MLIDMKKAYDRIDRVKLERYLREKKILDDNEI